MLEIDKEYPVEEVEEKLIKVSEFAKQLGLSPSELKERLVRMGAPIASTSSKVPKKYENLLLKAQAEKKTPAPKIQTVSAESDAKIFRSSSAAQGVAEDGKVIVKPKRKIKILDDGTTIFIKEEEPPKPELRTVNTDGDIKEPANEEEEMQELAKRAQEYESKINNYMNRAPIRNAPELKRKKVLPTKTEGSSGKKRKKKREENERIKQELIRPLEHLTEEQLKTKTEKEINICVLEHEMISVRDLAPKLGVSLGDLMVQCMKMGLRVTVNQEVDIPTVEKIAERFGIMVEAAAKKKETLQEQLLNQVDQNNQETWSVRAPVITIMGHVDHGKTKLLDAIRKTNVVAQEAGGITQHIGAYQVQVKDRKLTFLDTPGHEAFTTLRARGAQVTDIVVLLVAADDGFMPQTIEALHHAKAAKVPIVVAINKVDKPSANIERVKQQLAENELLPEEWGGETVVCPVSAVTGQGVDHLLEMLMTVADLLDLKASLTGKVSGVIIEARMDSKKGPIATVLIKSGTLEIGVPFIMGTSHGKVRAIYDDHLKSIKRAEPAMPVQIIGMNEVPPVGVLFQEMNDERDARLEAERRSSEQKNQRSVSMSLQKLSQEVAQGKSVDFNLIIKADVRGSIEALENSLQKLKMDKVHLGIVHSANGDINESDIMLAKASQAIVIGFNVGITAQAKQLAEEESVTVQFYNIIYKLVEDMESAMDGLLEIEKEEVQIGTIEVRSLFKSSKTGTIAGCFVNDGFIKRDSVVQVKRAAKELFKGPISSLKRFKDDAKEVKQGFEFGLSIHGFEDFQEGDQIFAFELRVKERKK